MFNEIEDLNKEIEKFKTNIVGSDKLIESLRDVSTSFRLQTKKSDNVLNEFKDTFMTLKTQFINTHNDVIERQNEISEKGLKKIEEISSHLNSCYIELNQNVTNLLQELKRNNETEAEYNKLAFNDLNSRINIFKNKTILWLTILSGIGFILIVISIISLILLTI